MKQPSQDSTQRLYRRLFWVLLCGVTVYRLSLAAGMGLGVDESHYVMFSRNLAWGYLDHPPMVAFLAALTGFLGKGIFYIRLGPILCASIALVGLRRLSLLLYADERIAFWALVLLLAMPYQHLLMVALLPDAPLNLFWCAALVAFWYAVTGQRWSAWVVVGLLFGGALLSKYHGVLLAMCLWAYLLASSRYRFWVKRPQPYIAALIGLVVFLPNVLWNANHDWISYRFQLAHGGSGGFELVKPFQVLGGQLGVWSPILFVFLVVSCAVLARTRPIGEADRFVLWTSLPAFIFFCGIGSFGQMLPHWPSVGWWTGSIAVSRTFVSRSAQGAPSRTRWRRWFVAGVGTGFMMTAVLYIGLFFPIVQPLYAKAREISLNLHGHVPWVRPLAPFRSEYDISNDLFGWEEIAHEVETLKERMPHPEKSFVFCHRFYTASQIGVYLSPNTPVTTLGHRIDQYHLWFSPARYRGWDALFVEENRFFKGPERYRALFEKVDLTPKEFKVYRKGRLSHHIRVYRYYGFKGKFQGE